MTTTPAPLLALLLLLSLLPRADAAEGAVKIDKVEATSLDGLVFAVSLQKPKKGANPPAPFATLASTGHTCSFQNGRMVLVIAGLPPIPPIPYQATRQGDLIHIACADGVEVIDKANKSALIGDLAVTGAISDAGKAFSGELEWKLGETKNKKKLAIGFDGARPAKAEKPEKPAKP